MVTVYHHTEVNVFANGRRHVGRNCFFHVAIKLHPIKRLKGSQVNVRVCGVKDESLSPSTPPFLTLQFYKKDLTPTPNLLRISGRYSLNSGIFDTLSAWAYLFSPLKVIRVTGSVRLSCKPTVGSHRRCHGQLLLQACGVWRH